MSEYSLSRKKDSGFIIICLNTLPQSIFPSKSQTNIVHVQVVLLYYNYLNKLLYHAKVNSLWKLAQHCLWGRLSSHDHSFLAQVACLASSWIISSIFDHTVMVLSFRTDMPEQTVQIQRVYIVCHSVCIVWTHYSMVEPHSSNFRVITTNFWSVQIFRKFMVFVVVLHQNLSVTNGKPL